MFTALPDCCPLRGTPILYACAHGVSFPDHSQCSGNETNAHTKLRALTMYQYARLAQSIPVVVGKAYGHHIGKEMYSVLIATL